MVIEFEGYFDESGDFDVEPKIFGVSGYFATSEQARVMDAEWGKVLQEHSIPYFHMVDCAHGTGIFAGKDKSERIAVATKLIDLIKLHTLAGFSALAHAEFFNASDSHPNIYSSCADMCVTALYSFLDVNRLTGGTIAYFFETGHKNKGDAYRHVAAKLIQFSASLVFAKKDQAPLLQAADLLAWQSVKYVKDRMSGDRPPRKDFLSLMEHRHSLVYLTVKESEPSLAFEEFPLSARSPTTAALSLKGDGPITHYVVGDDPTPIVPIRAAPGWALGPGRSALVQFQDFSKRSFFLGFDEMRLHEAMLALMSATEVYADRDHRPVIAVVDVAVGARGEEVLLKMQITPDVAVHFRTSRESAKRLRDRLDSLNP